MGLVQIERGQMASDKPPTESEKSEELPEDLLETEEDFGTDELSAAGNAETGYAVRPRTPAEEDRVQATLDTEDVVVLLPTEETSEAELLPEVEVVGGSMSSGSSEDFLKQGSGLRADLAAAPATESIGAAGDGFGITDEVGATDTATAPVNMGADTETGSWNMSSEVRTLTETEELPELEDVEDITAMLPEEGGFDLVAPTEDLDAESVFFSEEEPESSNRSWMPVLAVAAVLIGAVYFGLDFYRDRLDSQPGPDVARNVIAGPGGEAKVDPAGTEPGVPEGEDPSAMVTDPVNPDGENPDGATPGGELVGEVPLDVNPNPEDPTSVPAVTGPGSDGDDPETQFRSWVGRSLVSHFNLKVEEKN